MHSVIYISTAVKGLSKDHIHFMLLMAKQFNKENNISGCILFHDNHFIQLIEGKEADITSLYARIQADQRHFDVKTLLETKSEDRLYQNWSMAFYDISGDAYQMIYRRLLLETFLDSADVTENNKHIILCLRQSFKDLLEGSAVQI